MRKIFLSLPLFLLVFSGCAPSVSQSNLYWGSYSDTLYDVRKYDTEDVHRAHEAELASIVEESTRRGLKVPPGIYAELGLYALKRGDRPAAENYFSLEQQIYPEAAILFENSRDLLF